MDKTTAMLSNNITKSSIVIAGTAAAAFYLYRSLNSTSKYVGTLKTQVQFDGDTHGGNLVAKVLSAYGVEFIFTLIGGHISPILIGCENEKIRIIDVRHEVTAVFAADAVSRITGIPGVAAVTAGPGLTNTITAVKNAQMAQSPLILIGGATSDLLKGRGSLQDIDQFALLKPHVKWSCHIKSVAEIVDALEYAFYISREGTPGPVFLEFPIDTLYPQPVVSQWYLKNQDQSNMSLGNRLVNFYIKRNLSKIFDSAMGKQIDIHNPPRMAQPGIPERKLRKYLDLIKNAKKPVLVVGSQATLLSDNVSAGLLQEAVQEFGIPTFTSSMARGLLGASNPNLFRHCRSHALKNADLVILAGVVCDFRLNYGKSISSRATVISVNRSSEDLNKNRRPTYGVVGDPATFIIQLGALLKVCNLNLGKWNEELERLDNNRNMEIIGKCNLPEKEGFLNPLKTLQLFDEILPTKSILIADGGDYVASASYIVRPRGPLCWLDPGAFGTLGCAAGFALGAKLCKPDHQVWIVFGDGACGYSIPEYDTFVRHKISVGAIVGNDACWMQIMREQVDSLKSEVGCNLAYTDYDQVVKAFGGEGFKVTNESELKSALSKSSEILKENVKPVLINCHIGRTDFRKGSISV
eukprot:gene853-1063_t